MCEEMRLTEQTRRLVALVLLTPLAGLAKPPPVDMGNYVEPKEPAVKAALETFRDRKLGLMLHFGLYSQTGIVESWPLSDEDSDWSRREVERDLSSDEFKKQYYALSRSFNPVRYRPEAWADAAVRGGFKYVIFTTKHHDGFCLYDSKFSDYKTTDPSCPFSANPRADIVKTLFNACRARGLGVTAYYSKADWHHPDYWDDAGIGHSTTRNPTFEILKNLPRWKRFQDFTRNQLLELVREYGPIDALWLDCSWIYGEGPASLNLRDIVAEARKTTPGLLVADRWQCTDCENFKTPEQYVPDEPEGVVPWESCITLADHWGYHYDDSYKSVHQVIHLLVDVVAKGGNLLLNVGPMPDGRLPYPAVKRLEELGDWLGKNGETIYATRIQEPYKAGSWAFTRSKDGKRVFAICLWKEGERELHTQVLEGVKDLGAPKRVVHLATGLDIPFSGRKDGRTVLEFPAGFNRDAHADAFEIFK